MASQDGGAGDRDTNIYRRSLFEDPEDGPSHELVSEIAELKDVDATELDPLYTWADDLISHLYSKPPSPRAQAVVEFNYEGFRITLYQDGHAVLMRRTTSG